MLNFSMDNSVGAAGGLVACMSPNDVIIAHGDRQNQIVVQLGGTRRRPCRFLMHKPLDDCKLLLTLEEAQHVVC